MKCLHSQEVNISSDQIFLKCLGSRKFWNEHLLCPGWFEMFGMECFEMNRWNEHLLWPECFAGWFRSPSQWLSLPQRTTVPHHATSCHSVTQPCASQLLVHLHVHHLVHLQNHIHKHLTTLPESSTMSHKGKLFAKPGHIDSSKPWPFCQVQLLCVTIVL